jgi:hypothetical protein
MENKNLTGCSTAVVEKSSLLWYAQNSRKIVAHFNGGNITSDAGGLLLQQAERVTGIISQFADRTGAATMRTNQLRLWFSSAATNRFFQWKLGNSARRTRWLKASALKIDQFSAGTTNQLRYQGNQSRSGIQNTQKRYEDLPDMAS